MCSNNCLTLGGKLVIFGCLLGSICIVLLLYWFTSALTYPTSSLAAQTDNSEVVSTSGSEQEETNRDTTVINAELDRVEQISENCEIGPRFPSRIRRWCDWIMLYSKKHDLPPDLVAAVIWQESGGSPTAYSGSGAVGLMQIMPKNGLAASFQCPNGPCFANRPTIDKLKDPEFNISYGTRMLGGLVKRHGNYREALKSYGPMDVGYYYADKILGIYKRYGD